jgi:glycosyltransferase involved in cell wall biosynthesis
MKILQVAYPFEPVSDRSAGGTEQIVWALDRELDRMGCRTTVLAREGSRVHGRLMRSASAGASYEQSCRELDIALDALLGAEQFDVVHNQGSHVDRAWRGAVPLLTTLHLARTLYGTESPVRTGARRAYNLVSDAQRREYPELAPPLPVVPNGIALDCFQPALRRGGYALAIGRICPEKGFHHAIAAARAAGVPLTIIGKVYGFESHRAYFAAAIAPHLGAAVRLVEAPPLEAKRALLAGARCVVIPSEIAETSSLVAMEAAASGTAVICFCRGALPEVVVDGRTGYVVEDVPAMAEAIRCSERIDPAVCRAHAESRFSAARMAARYLELYTALRSAR